MAADRQFPDSDETNSKSEFNGATSPDAPCSDPACGGDDSLPPSGGVFALVTMILQGVNASPFPVICSVDEIRDNVSALLKIEAGGNSAAVAARLLIGLHIWERIHNLPSGAKGSEKKAMKVEYLRGDRWIEIAVRVANKAESLPASELLRVSKLASRGWDEFSNSTAFRDPPRKTPTTGAQIVARVEKKVNSVLDAVMSDVDGNTTAATGAADAFAKAATGVAILAPADDRVALLLGHVEHAVGALANEVAGNKGLAAHVDGIRKLVDAFRGVIS